MDTAQLNKAISHQIDLLILQTKNSNQINPSELTRLAGSIETIRSYGADIDGVNINPLDVIYIRKDGTQ